MSEGERTVQSVSSELRDDAEGLSSKPHQRLGKLIALANAELNSEERQRLANEVIDTLVAMRAPGDEADEARVLLAALDSNSLSTLAGSTGRTAHHQAVETLLSLGFPHAMGISPEDMRRYREGDGSVGARALNLLMARRNAAIAATVGGAAAAAHGLFLDPALLGPQLGLAALAGAGALILIASEPTQPVPQPRWLFLLGVLGSACVTLMGGGPLPIVAGVALAVATFFSFRVKKEVR